MIAKAVIDSSALFRALLLNYNLRNAEYRRHLQFERMESPLRDLRSQEEYLLLLSSIREKLITSHVIGELNGLATSRLKLHGEDRLNFWRISIDLLLRWNIEEKLISVLTLAADATFEDCLPRIGIVDTGLIDLALQHGCLLITEDERTLAVEAWKRGVDCKLVKHLVTVR